MNRIQFFTRFTLAALIIFGAQLSLPTSAPAMAGTDRVASPGKTVTENSGWPDGALALVNDPLRTDGWNPWFSELSNDMNFYEYKIRRTEDVNHLLELLAAIKTTNVVLRLSPAKRAEAIGFGVKTTDQNQTAAVFSLGNQQRLDEWYKPLPEVTPGVRGFGLWRYTNAPVASPPTLTLYTSHEAVDLSQLKIPASVQVVSAVDRAEKDSAEATKSIESFIANRKAGKRAANDSQNAPASPARVQSASLAPSDGERAGVRGFDSMIESCLRDFESIKPGMTRGELEKKFNLDGGVQGASPVRFVHPSAPLFKVDVEFDFKRNAADQGRAISSKDDKVTRVSKPYLERPFMD